MGRKNQFTYNGLRVLFDYFEGYEEDTGEEVEMDVIAICCEFNEDYCEEIAQNYNIDISDCIDEVGIVETVCEYINHHSLLVGVTDDGFIVYAAF
jgi:hypothetical protein